MNALEAFEGLCRRRYRGILAAVLLLGLLLRVGVHLELRAESPFFDAPILDSRVFLNWAGGIAAGDVVGDRPFFLNPLYPYFLAPILKIAGGAALDAVRAIQVLLGLASVLLVAGAARRLLGEAVALLAALLMAAYPPLQFFEQSIMIVPLAVFLNALLLRLLVRLAERRDVRSALLAGAALGLSMLARPNVGLFALLLPLWLLSVAPERARRLRFAAGRTALVAAGAIAALLPVTFRNLAVGGELVLVTTSGGLNLWQSNNPEAWTAGRMVSAEVRSNPVLIETDAHAFAEREEGRPLTPSEVSRFWSRRTLRVCAESPGRALGFLGRKLLLFLGGYEVPSSQNYEAERRETAALGLNPLGFSVVGPLALLGLLATVRRRRGGALFAWFFLAYAIGLTVFFPLGHYRAPVLPAAFPLAALGALDLLAAALAAPRPRPVLARGAALLLALLLTNAAPLVRTFGLADWGGHEEAGTHLCNRGFALLGRGDVAGAERCFATARDLEPRSWLPDVGMAGAARARGDAAEEIRLLRSALAKRPDDPPTLAKLGRALFLSGEREEGFRHAGRAVALSPHDWLARAALGEIQEGLGRPAAALREYEAAAAAGMPYPAIFADQARCLRALGRPADALARVARGLAVDPVNPALRLERALGLVAAGGADPREVRRALEPAREAGLEIPPDLEAWLASHR